VVEKAKKKPKPKKSPKAKNEGQRQLLEQSGTEIELAKQLGCGAAIVGHWRRGRRLPGDAHRHKLELLFGIPRRAWDVAPGTKVESASTPKKKKKSLSRGDAATLEITKEQIDNILTSLEDTSLTDSAVAKLRDTLSKLLALRARLERDQELLEDRIVREHPEWVRLKSRILAALEPYPEAAAAVVEAMR